MKEEQRAQDAAPDDQLKAAGFKAWKHCRQKLAEPVQGRDEQEESNLVESVEEQDFWMRGEFASEGRRCRKRFPSQQPTQVRVKPAVDHR